MSSASSGDTIGVISGKSCRLYEWYINDFFALAPEADTFYRSPRFEVLGAKWFLQLYPNGTTSHKSEGWLTLCLCKIESKIVKHSLHYKLGILKEDGTEYKSFGEEDDFLKGDYIGSSFLKRDVLFGDKHVVAPSGVLTFFCLIYNDESSFKDVPSENISTNADPIRTSEKRGDNGKSTENDSKSGEDEIEGKDQDKRAGWLVGWFSLTGARSNQDKREKEKVEAIEDNGSEATSPSLKENPKTSTEAQDDGEPKKDSKMPEEFEIGDDSELNEKVDIEAEEKCESKDIFPNLKGFEVLSQNFEELFHNRDLCDVTVKVQGRVFKAHKLILIARSSVFASMLQHDMKERNTGVVNIADCDPDAFEDFLLYLYCGKLEIVSSKNVIGLYTAADKYDIQELKEECVCFMMDGLSLDLICDVIVLASKHGETELIKRCTEYFIENAEEILFTTQWQMFMEENPVSANELYIKTFRTVVRRR